MRSGVRAVIIDQGDLLVLKQVKNGETYFVFPGGGVEEGETDTQALKRECIEEIGVRIVVGKLLLDYSQFLSPTEEVTERFYSCHVLSAPATDSAEFKAVRIPLSDSAALDIRPKKVKDILSKSY